MKNSGSLFHSTIDRLAHLILRHYGCPMEYMHLGVVQHDLPSKVKTELILGRVAKYGPHVYIPAFLHRRLAGAVFVRHAGSLAGEQFNLMRQTVQMVIEAALLNLDRIDILDKIEAQYKELESPSNVLTLSQYRSNALSIQNHRFERNESFDFACLIEGSSQEDIFKMALEIHQHSGRYAFLPYQDLTEDVWNSNDELARLGHATIYIDNVFRLTLERQKFLTGYLPQRERMASPQIIVATEMPYRELKDHADVLPKFLNLITIGYLQMSRPFSSYKKENLIHFFFGELSGRTHLSAYELDPSTDHSPPH